MEHSAQNHCRVQHCLHSSIEACLYVPNSLGTQLHSRQYFRQHLCYFLAISSSSSIDTWGVMHTQTWSKLWQVDIHPSCICGAFRESGGHVNTHLWCERIQEYAIESRHWARQYWSQRVTTYPRGFLECILPRPFHYLQSLGVPDHPLQWTDHMGRTADMPQWISKGSIYRRKCYYS